MFCPNCGSQIPDESRLCPSCGATIGAPEPEPEPVPGPEPTPEEPARPSTGMPPVPGAEPEPSPVHPVPAGAAEAPGMKWFKFIIWVQLFLSALMLAASSIMLFTGARYMTEYGSARDLVYLFFPGLQAVDVLFAVAFLALAIWCIVVRMGLAKFKKGAPTQYLVLLGVNIAAQILFAVATSAVTNVGIFDVMDPSSLSQVVVSVVMIFVNKVYFDKRAYMFTN